MATSYASFAISLAVKKRKEKGSVPFKKAPFKKAKTGKKNIGSG